MKLNTYTRENRDERKLVPPEGNNILDKPFHACILLA